MKIKIDVNKINDYRSLEKVIINRKNIDMIKQHALNGKKSSYLISGYRGVGKTTLVKQLEKDLNESNNEELLYLFVYMNVNNYEGQSIFLRNLIRQIYLSLSSFEKYDEFKKKNSEICNKIEKLYEQTFFEISDSLIHKKTKIFDSTIEFKMNIKDLWNKIYPVIIMLASALGEKFIPFVTNSKFVSKSIFITGTILFLKNIGVFKFILQSKVEKQEEIERKALYDDEIASYQLNTILKSLNTNGINVFLIFDELDKIEDEEVMNTFLSDIKPLILLEEANTIVISGQKLFYKMMVSGVTDDALMASLFQKTVHVSFLEINELRLVIKEYISNKNEISSNNQTEELLNFYISSLVLESKMVLRVLNNLLIQKIAWNEKTAYIDVDDETFEKYKVDNSILNIIDNIIQVQIKTLGYEDGLTDFLCYQLFIWIRIIKLKGNISFTSREILGEKEELVGYPSWVVMRREILLDNLLENLKKEEIILEINDPTTDEQIKYQWNNKTLTSIDKFNELELEFFGTFRSFEKKLRKLYSIFEVNDRMPVSLPRMVSLLIDIGVINKNLGEHIQNLVMYRNKIVHAEQLTDHERDELDFMIETTKNSEIVLNEEFVVYTIKEYFSNKEYDIIKAEKSDISDIIVSNRYNGRDVIYVNIKNTNSSSQHLYNNMFKKVEFQTLNTDRIDNKFMTIIFSKDFINSEKKIRKLYKRNENLTKKFFIFDFSEFDLDYVYECYDRVMDLQ